MTEAPVRSLASQRRLREEGEAAILGALRLHGPLTRKEIAAKLNISRTTVFEIVRDLLLSSVLVELPLVHASPSRGRPTTVVALNPRHALVAGVEFARGRTRVLLINAAHEEVGYADEGASFLKAPRPLSRMLGLMRKAAAAGGVTTDHIKRIGLGWGGLLEPLVPDATVSRLCKGIETAKGATVRIANNSHLAALAETQWGAAQGRESVLYVHWSSGIGGGWVLKGAVALGTRNAAGQIGRAADDLAQMVGHRHQHFIAGGVAEAVVDRFETVQIDQQHGDGTATLLRPAQRGGDELFAGAAVLQAGEDVVLRQMQHFALLALAVGDVVEHTLDQADLAGAAVRRNQAVHPAAAAVGP